MKTIVAANSTEIIAKTRLGWPVFVAASWSHFDKVLFITIASENLKRLELISNRLSRRYVEWRMGMG
jgi:hypothetical protein